MLTNTFAKLAMQESSLMKEHIGAKRALKGKSRMQTTLVAKFAVRMKRLMETTAVVYQFPWTAKVSASKKGRPKARTA
jgi:hypothetical protein